MKNTFWMGALGACLFALPASAFNGVGTLGYAVQEGRQFNRMVHRLGARPQVQYASRRMMNQGQDLVQCVRRVKGGNVMATRRIPRRCASDLRDVRRVVDRISSMRMRRPLMRQIRQVERGVRALRVGHGGGTGHRVKCIAVDTGWEEHFGGHVAYGRGLRNAQRAALRACQRHHGSCRIVRCE